MKACRRIRNTCGKADANDASEVGQPQSGGRFQVEWGFSIAPLLLRAKLRWDIGKVTP